MSFSVTNDLIVDVKLDQSIYLIYGCGNNLFLGGFTSNVVNTRNDIANLNSLNSFLAKRGENRGTRNEAERGVHSSADTAHNHTGNHAVCSTLNDSGCGYTNYI